MVFLHSILWSQIRSLHHTCEECICTVGVVSMIHVGVDIVGMASLIVVQVWIKGGGN